MWHDLTKFYQKKKMYLPHIFFFCGARVSLSRGICWFIPGVAMGIPRAAYLVTCWSASPKQVWNRYLSTEALLFSQCNVTWGSFVWAVNSGCQSFDSSWWFFSCLVCFQFLSKIFDLQSSRCLLLPSSHHLGSFRIFVLTNSVRNVSILNKRKRKYINI
jgi:hypothetical protein